ncbi:Phage Mu protein F like protein [Tistlia consotensis]|uniref:Phage Mu protein F like protein n=1 Tax=Tistlia consotensis USBA 355 TaxID=560819 RepID=A0A1Y6CR44_9PROT|nr:PBECR2 nuclease fold domain-containing protein [Tistlia consotensis]SMF83008.1 Phage Mu protein F like protein [Tistlia consotensis USBA 355]SNS31746.1 Phage Mu protein F like protein [Tistlia consotensis]
MSDLVAPATPEPVVFKEAVDFLRQKLRLPTRAWTDLWQAQHARAFVVAGAMSDSLLADFQSALLKAMEDGGSYADWLADFDAIVARHGWSYNGGRTWRARTIFQANMRSANMAGRWRQIQRTKARRPYLRYVQVQRETKRPLHALWHGTILPIDDPFWRTHYPPNGWYCLCSVIALNARDLARNGWTVSAEAPPVNLRQVALNTPDGPATVSVPEGIDPGWGHNPGIADVGYGEQRVRLAGHEGRWEPLVAPSQVAPGSPLPDLQPQPPQAQLGPRATDAAGLRDNLRAVLGGDEAVLADPAGGQVSIGMAFADHLADRLDGRDAFFPLLPELIQDPQEIWAGFVVNDATGQVALRRRYVKLLQLRRDTTLALVADADNGTWSGLTFFRGKPDALKRLRWGLSVYRK